MAGASMPMMAQGAGVLDYALPIISQVASVAAMLAGNASKRKQRRKVEALEAELKRGISDDEVLTQTALARKAALPALNSIVGSGIGKFGSRSGAALGAAVHGVNQGLAAPAANLYGDALQMRKNNLRRIYEVNANLAN